MFQLLKQEIHYVGYSFLSRSELITLLEQQLPDLKRELDDRTCWHTFDIVSEGQEFESLKNIIAGEDPLAKYLHEQDAVTAEESQHARSMILIAGQRTATTDPINDCLLPKTEVSVFGTVLSPQDPLHDYLKVCDLISTLMVSNAFISIVDMKTLTLYSPAEWIGSITATLCHESSIDAVNVKNHIMIATMIDDSQAPSSNLYWLITKGMFKFGKPELSIRGVPEAEVKDAGGMLNALAQQMVTMNTIPPDQEMLANKNGFNCSAIHAGKYEDEDEGRDFAYNVRIELVRSRY